MDISLKSPKFMVMVVVLGLLTAVGGRLAAQDTPNMQVESTLLSSVSFTF